MKLVDILARELKEWPEGVSAISQGGITGELYDSSFQIITPVIRVSIADDRGCPRVIHDAAIVTRAQWEALAAVDALKNCAHLWIGWSDTEACELCNKIRKIVVEWNGEGLPPVGTVCECHLPGELTNNYSWVEAKVIWHNGPTECAVVRSTSKLAWCDEFRPIRTPEKIAAEEREAAIVEIMSASGLRARDGSREVATAIYDAGYRKFEIVDN
ncbi:MAG: hypothetical protein [Caudoviricetes sp.]|nr:MAG: hypothetical protein [Caudoviricetes sp.]